MDLAPIQRKVDATEIAPERLAGNSQLTKQEKIAEASRQFEAVLLRQILENSQKTVIKSRYGDNSASSAIYRDQVTAQMADSISKAGTFGFAKTFEQQLNRPAEVQSSDAGRADVTPTFGSAGSRGIPVPGGAKPAVEQSPQPVGWKARLTGAPAPSISHPIPAPDSRGHSTFKTP